MKLVRLVQFRLAKMPNSDWLTSWHVGMEHVSAKKISHESRGDGVRIMVSAEISIDLPEIECGLIKIPDESRIKCESILNFLINVMAIQSCCAREIVSVTPPVFLIKESADDDSHLAKTFGIEDQTPKIKRFQPYVRPDDLQQLLIKLTDRKEAVAILAEALTHSTASGEYRDLVRLFEHAFGGSHSKIDKKLYQFLNSSMSYSRKEVIHWLSMRNGISHGDSGHAEKLILESDVSKIVPRMEQAALDVIFNKRVWGVNSKQRRNFWDAKAFTNSQDHTTVQLDREAEITIELMDVYDVYPVKIDNNVVPYVQNENFPPNWWPMTPYSKNKAPTWSINAGKVQASQE